MLIVSFLFRILRELKFLSKEFFLLVFSAIRIYLEVILWPLYNVCTLSIVLHKEISLYLIYSVNSFVSKDIVKSLNILSCLCNFRNKFLNSFDKVVFRWIVENSNLIWVRRIHVCIDSENRNKNYRIICLLSFSNNVLFKVTNCVFNTVNKR